MQQGLSRTVELCTSTLSPYPACLKRVRGRVLGDSLSKAIVTVALILFCAVRPLSSRAAEKSAPNPGWVSATSNVGGEKWGYAGVCSMAAVPGTSQVIAGVSESGLWLTSDGGKNWKRLGDADAIPIRNRPYQIIFDPKDPATFWESGSYGAGVFKTTDGGKTFIRLGAIENVDGLGIDFTDPARKTLVAGLHEQDRSVHKSVDGGQTWQKIGDKLPAATSFSSDVIVLDASNFLVNAAGWKRDQSWGIFRTSDGGAAWTKVSDAGPSGPALVASNGAIFWQTLWGAGLIQSVDGGRSWKKLSGPIKVNPIELPDGKLLAPVESQLFISSDKGATWTKFADPLPFKPSGVISCAQGRCLYAWRSTESKEENAIVRWDLP